VVTFVFYIPFFLKMQSFAVGEDFTTLFFAVFALNATDFAFYRLHYLSFFFLDLEFLSNKRFG